MKIFRKEKLANGRRHIYLFGIKIASYKKRKNKYLNIVTKTQKNIPEVLCYTYANEPYFPFAILYPLFILISNKNVAIEIAVEDYDKFIKEYNHLVEYYDKYYKDKVFFHPVDNKKHILPGTMRFINQPLWRGEYVYISDVDIMINEEIAKTHIENIKKHNLDFSNIKRKGLNKLSGLHFIEYNKMYPIKIPKNINLQKINDEDLLFIMMQHYGYKIPDENKCTLRPLHGMHFSFYSRPPLPTLTTKDKIVTELPSWFNNSTNTITKESCSNAKKFIKIRYSKKFVDFTNKIRPYDINLRKIIQYMDMSCWYFINQDKLKTE